MFKKYKIEIIIFLAALILRLIFSFFLYRTEDVSSFKKLSPMSSDGYYDIAYNLVHYRVFSGNTTPPIIPDAERTPGYPLAIAASLYIFNFFWPLVIGQIIIGSVLPVLGRKLSQEIIPNKTVANLVGWLMVVEPVGIWLSVWMISETFFTFFLLLFSLLIIKFIKITRSETGVPGYGLIAWSAILLGVATLVRPTTLYLPLILIPIWLVNRYFSKSQLLLKPIMVFLALFILVLSPWLYRNYRTFGVTSVSSIQGEVMFCALAPSVLAVKNHAGYTESQISFFKSQGLDHYPVVNLNNARWFERQAILVLRQNPKESALVAGVSLITFFTHDGMLTLLGSLRLIEPSGLTLGKILSQPFRELSATFKKLLFSPAAVIIFMRAFWFITTILFLLAVVRDFFKKKFTNLSIFALTLIAYFALTTLSNGFGVNARFRFPVNVFIFMFALDFLFHIINFFKQNLKQQAN